MNISTCMFYKGILSELFTDLVLPALQFLCNFIIIIYLYCYY